MKVKDGCLLRAQCSEQGGGFVSQLAGSCCKDCGVKKRVEKPHPCFLLKSINDMFVSAEKQLLTLFPSE